MPVQIPAADAAHTWCPWLLPCSYWLRYWVLAWGELPLYAARRRRWRELAACLAAELAYLGVVRALWLFNPLATKWVFVVPFFLSSFALMFGNW